MLFHALLLAALQPVGAPPPESAIPLVAPYDRGNVFARIIRGELPAVKVYEDAHVLAFMDRAPVSAGHVLVISKTARARTLLDMPDRDLARVMKVARRIARAQVAGLGAAGVRLIQNNGYGQSVPHFHLHVVPRYPGVPLDFSEGRTRTLVELEPVAARIRGALR
ncbi:MAG: HIT domain-containing protein [Sphingomonas sp.]